jgi:two-component system, OmpR family, KDP operon response regulator KdpE
VSEVRNPDTGDEVHLTRTVRQLLERPLVRHPGAPITQRQLPQQICGPDYSTETQSLRQYMAQLRRSLLTVPGLGYRFAPQRPPNGAPLGSDRGPADPAW